MNAIKLIFVPALLVLAIEAEAQRFIIVRPKTPVPVAKETKTNVSKRPNTAKRNYQHSKPAKNNKVKQEANNQEESTPTVTWPRKMELKFDSGTFNGYMDQDLNMLNGVFTWNNGNKFEGTFENNQLKQGKLYMKDGDMFDGSFVNGDISEGKLISKDGSVFDGKYANGKMLEGKLTLSDGDTYEGTFVNGEKSRGKYTWANGAGLSFDGTFQNDQMYNGTLLYRGGNVFEGTLRNNIPYEGKLTMQYGIEALDGQYFVGTFDSNGGSYNGTWFYKDGKKMSTVKNGKRKK